MDYIIRSILELQLLHMKSWSKRKYLYAGCFNYRAGEKRHVEKKNVVVCWI